MRSGGRALLALVALGVLMLPLATAHAVLTHVTAGHGDRIASLLEHPELLAVLTVAVVALVPLAECIEAASRWVAARRRLRAFTAAALPRSLAGIDYLVVPSTEVLLFTTGIRHPRVYVSMGAEQRLARDALHAALLHERAHATRGDVLWLAVTASLEAALRRVPWSRETFRALRVAIEQDADRAAVAAGAGRLALFEAIVAASSVREPVPAGIAGAGVQQRLRWLADDAAVVELPPRGVALLLGTVMVPPLLAHALLWTSLLCLYCGADPH